MIDIESSVVNAVYTALKEAEENEVIKRMPTVASQYVREPAEFPFVSVEEVTNRTVANRSSSSRMENFASLTYEIRVFSDDVTRKKQDCKDILAVINDKLEGLNFSRISTDPLPDYGGSVHGKFETTVYCIIARFTAVADVNGRIYRN